MKKKKRNILLSILIGAFLLCAVAGGTFYYYLFAPQFHPPKTVYIYVDRDDTADSISIPVVMPFAPMTMFIMYIAVFPEVIRSL